MKREHYHLLQRIGTINNLVLNLIDYANGLLVLDDPKLSRTGGYLTIMNRRTGEIVLILAIGSFSTEKSEKYFNYSVGKARQLYRHRLEHWSSAQSAADGFPQGAIIIGDYIWSFSGHESGVDEAISAVAGVKFSFSDRSTAETSQIEHLEEKLENSGNKLYPKLKALADQKGDDPGY